MLHHSQDASLHSSVVVTHSIGNYDTVDLAPTRDTDSLIATFVMFVARLARCTTFDLDLTEAYTTPRSSVLRIQLDAAATVAAMHAEVDAALDRARAELSPSWKTPPLPVGVVLVNRLADPLPATRMLTLVLSTTGAARWHYDVEAFSRDHIHSLAQRFTRLIELRANARWSRASVPGAPLEFAMSAPESLGTVSQGL